MSYSNKKINQLNIDIKKEKYLVDKNNINNELIIDKYFDIFNSNNQCSDITEFPDNFT